MDSLSHIPFIAADDSDLDLLMLDDDFDDAFFDDLFGIDCDSTESLDYVSVKLMNK